MRFQRPEGFTLIESVAALAVAGIALLALLQLQLLSMHTADKARVMTQAVLLAQEKMTEVLSSGYPSLGVQSGMVETEGEVLTWRTEVTDTRLPAACRPAGRGARAGDRLRTLSVEVSWPRGAGDKHIRMTTCVAENLIRET
jgi:type II secretion system protein I